VNPATSAPATPATSAPAPNDSDPAVVQAGHQTPVAPETLPTPRVAEAPPGPAPVTPPTDPHQRPAPTATGCLLNLPPGESPIERLTAVTMKLGESETERRNLEAKLQQVTAKLEQSEKALQLSTVDVREAAEEVQRTRELVQTLRQEMDEVRAAHSKREKDDVERLKTINKLLERLAGEDRKPIVPQR
jgi:hypothetical protein